ncbi:hypothetical protein DFH07DRAFT_939156 [Mycena maculata]|uniref:Uncharacterized protein n=1 Tax=Mycena maculata TaxID=230809 RepID=A0AAD7JFZ7_9AGAR|nr:hypothetical protein DFH07DRAFT_939156 [Mycena maculata]
MPGTSGFGEGLMAPRIFCGGKTKNGANGDPSQPSREYLDRVNCPYEVSQSYHHAGIRYGRAERMALTMILHQSQSVWGTEWAGRGPNESRIALRGGEFAKNKAGCAKPK